MKLVFLGTRGGIISHSEFHNKHSSLLVSYYSTDIIIDCGLDWINKMPKADAIFVTHAHNDHVGGLSDGSSCPVWATQDTWSKIKKYPIKEKKIIEPNKVIKIGSIIIEAFEVWHSIHAPAIGYKITCGNKSIFYAPDLVAIKQENKALRDIDVYIGDGAIIKRKILIRKKDNQITGHVPISMQAQWCKKYNVPLFIVTHCGSEIVKGDKKVIEKKLEILSKDYGIKIQLAFDGFILYL